MVNLMRDEHQVSLRQGCKAVGLPRSSYSYQRKPKDDQMIVDSLWDGRCFRMLNVMDDYNRQVLWIETDTSLPTLRVIRVLDQLKESRGLPEMIRVDNGPEFISRKLDIWSKDNHVTLAFIQPGKPT